MQNDQQALINGLLFGSDEGFSANLKQLTRDAGVSHLVAASGANLRFVEILWNQVFWLFGTGFVQFTSILAVAGYWFLAEPSGSLWRASLMWTFSWLGRLVGKRIPAWYSLGMTVLLTVVAAQAFLTPGFWLSTLAIIGLFFSRLLISGEKKKALFPHVDIWSNSVALSLAEGSIIFAMVTVWLWTQYEVFQPIGIFSTWVLGSMVDPLVWLGVAQTFSTTLELPLEGGLGAFLDVQTLIFTLFLQTLEFFATAAAQLPTSLLTLSALVLVWHFFRSWWRRRQMTQRWKGVV